MLQTKQIFFLLATASLPLACNLDQDGGQTVQPFEHLIVITNQGNYSEKNGSISYFYEANQILKNGVIKDLGSIIQSTKIMDDDGSMYLVCNAPDKLEFINYLASDNPLKASVTDSLLINPRYLTGNDKYLFITNWGQGVGTDWLTYPDSYVLVLTRDSDHKFEFMSQIKCGSDAEDIVIASNNKLYVATAEGVAVIAITDMGIISDFMLEKTIVAPTYTGAKHIILDEQSKRLWVSYPGLGLVEIDLMQETVINEYEVPMDWMGQIAWNPGLKKIYTYNTDYSAQTSAIYEFDMTAHTYKTFASGSYFYSIGVSVMTGNIYTSEVNNFASNSELLVFDVNGNKIELQNNLTGIGTCEFDYIRVGLPN
jgi:hypothetical protein